MIDIIWNLTRARHLLLMRELALKFIIYPMVLSYKKIKKKCLQNSKIDYLCNVFEWRKNGHKAIMF